MPSDAYRADLAYIHDAGFGDLAADAADRLIYELTAAGLRDGTVVDLGCGSGILASKIENAGYHVVGIDQSEAMIALARARAPKAEFRVGSFVSADLPECIAVTAIGEVLNYAFDVANDGIARRGLVRRVHRALLPGGIFLFDLAGPDRAPAEGSRRTFAEGEDWAILSETTGAHGVLTRTITSFRQIGGVYRRDREVHRLVLIDRSQALDLLRDESFEVETIPAYGRISLPVGLAAFLARKRREE